MYPICPVTHVIIKWLFPIFSVKILNNSGLKSVLWIVGKRYDMGKNNVALPSSLESGNNRSKTTWQQLTHTPWSQSLQRSTCSSNRCTWWGLPAGFWEALLNQRVRCRDPWSCTGSQTLCRWFHSGKIKTKH